MKTFMNNFGLNPCSNGIQKYKDNLTTWSVSMSLNPCSNGIQKYSIS